MKSAAIPYLLSLAVALGAIVGTVWAWKQSDRPLPSPVQSAEAVAPQPAVAAPAAAQALDVSALAPANATVAPFTLTDQEGWPFDSASLKGRVWVVSFFFSACPSVCFKLNQAMAEVQNQTVGSDVRLVSITVDPERDTPEALKKYAERFKADHTRWTFLTGPMAQIEAIGVKNFRLATAQTTHSERAVVIDQEGRIAGAFNAIDPVGRQKLKDTVAQLLAAAK